MSPSNQVGEKEKTDYPPRIADEASKALAETSVTVAGPVAVAPSVHLASGAGRDGIGTHAPSWP
jgi:hypothetical protein